MRTATGLGPGPDAMIGDCLIIPAYGDKGGVADLNSDGIVSIQDLSILLSRVAAATGSCTATP